jgi:antigen flippase
MDLPFAAGSRSPAQAPLWRLRAVATDAGALVVANLAFMVTGIIRTKFAAVYLGPEGLGAISQLTQAVGFMMAFSVLGLGTGIRLTLSRPSVRLCHKQNIAQNVIFICVIVALFATLLGVFFADFIARFFLGGREYSVVVKIALFSVPWTLLTQLFIPIAQAAGEFKRLVVAASVTGASGVIIVVAMLPSRNLTLAALSIPLAAVTQTLSVGAICPSIRSLFRVKPAWTGSALGEIVRIGSMSFLIAASTVTAESIVRSRMVATGGLELAAFYQPVYLVSNSAYGLLLGALATSLMVHVNMSLSSTDDLTRLNTELNRVMSHVVLLALTCGLLVQIFAAPFVTILFDSSILKSASTVAQQPVAEIFTASTWVMEAVLLPLSMRKAWLWSGMATATTQVSLLWFMLPSFGIAAVPWASMLSWLCGFGVCLAALSKRRILLSARNIQLITMSVVLLTFCGLSASYVYSWSIPISPLVILSILASGAALLRLRSRLARNDSGGVGRNPSRPQT